MSTNFEFDGDKYKKASTHQKEWGAKLISELKFNGAEHILDLGCGDGSITADLAKCVPDGSVLGIDASKGMIETALKSHQSSNLQFQLLDINSMDFQTKFDIIISNATLHWVKDHSKLLQNVYNALKPNGIVRFNFAAGGNCSNFFKVIKEVMQTSNFSDYFKTFLWPWYMPELEDYKGLVNQLPFNNIRVWGENADRNFPDAEAMIKWIDQPSIVPLLKCVEEEDKQKFRDTVVSRMIQETKQADGTCFETFRRVNLLAEKGI
ncbi:MAG: methyltransferase domain-containing protein [Bacteroidetes bacterium]|nr:methyltransferase domain-containing protein [Bacteroidota bacterium]